MISKTHRIVSLVLAAAFLLAACAPAPAPPTVDLTDIANRVSTAVAGTVAAQQTGTAAAVPPATATPVPVDTANAGTAHRDTLRSAHLHQLQQHGRGGCHPL
jgi:hypothetical protein